MDSSHEENEPVSAGRDGGPANSEEPLWTPPQFGLKDVLIAVTVLSVMCAAIKVLGIESLQGFFGLVILGLFAWLVLGGLRLVGLSRREHLLQVLRRKRKRDIQDYWIEHARWLNETAPKDGGAGTSRDAEDDSAETPPE